MDVVFATPRDLPYTTDIDHAWYEEIGATYRIPGIVGETEIQMFGIAHKPSFYEEYEDLLTDHISSSDGLVIETPLGDDPWEVDAFRKPTEIAYDEDTALYIADPLNEGLYRAEQAQLLSPAAAGLVGAGVMARAQYRHHKSDDASPELTRREMLATLAPVISSLYLAGNTRNGRGVLQSATDLDRTLNEDDWAVTYGWDDRLGYGMQDYRNVTIADNLLTLVETGSDIDKITTIHGALHGKTVAGYMQESATREIAETLYTAHDRVADEQLEKYLPSDDGSWEQVSL